MNHLLGRSRRRIVFMEGVGEQKKLIGMALMTHQSASQGILGIDRLIAQHPFTSPIRTHAMRKPARSQNQPKLRAWETKGGVLGDPPHTRHTKQVRTRTPCSACGEGHHGEGGVPKAIQHLLNPNKAPQQAGIRFIFQAGQIHAGAKMSAFATQHEAANLFVLALIQRSVNILHQICT